MENRTDGFLNALFDFSFSKFITLSIVKLLYAIGIAVALIATLGMVGTSFTQGVVAGIIALMVSPIFFLLYVIALRVWLELVIVIFRIADHTAKIAGETGQGEQESESPKE